MSACSQYGRPELEFVVVVAKSKTLVPPCGMCLQVIAEFCSPEMPVYLCNTDSIQKEVKFKELMGLAFTEIPNG